MHTNREVEIQPFNMTEVKDEQDLIKLSEAMGQTCDEVRLMRVWKRGTSTTPPTIVHVALCSQQIVHVWHRL
jgi:hypothetical protein